jgi:hypothetical protein
MSKKAAQSLFEKSDQRHVFLTKRNLYSKDEQIGKTYFLNFHLLFRNHTEMKHFNKPFSKGLNIAHVKRKYISINN